MENPLCFFIVRSRSLCATVIEQLYAYVISSSRAVFISVIMLFPEKPNAEVMSVGSNMPTVGPRQYFNQY
jgi:hypothetical protein